MKTKVKLALAAVLIIVVIVGFYSVTLLPKQHTPVVADRAFWLGLAENAWHYFQPGIGVDRSTGLHSASLGWPYFTDWDVGLYLQATLDAEKLGILNRAGEWGSDYRFNKVLSFLETRELMVDGSPYRLYNSGTGGRYTDAAPVATDTGKLLVALHNLRGDRPDLAGRIDAVVYNRTDYESLRDAAAAIVGANGSYTRFDFYDYYVACGFAFFWNDTFAPVAETVLSRIVSAPTVETYGVQLPPAGLLGEIVMHTILELPPEARVTAIGRQVYLASETRFNATGKYTAWSEGNTGLGEPSYIYEFVSFPGGRTWVVRSVDESDSSVTPIIYFKTAVGFLAIFDTAYAADMVGYVRAQLPNPSSGYCEGVDEGGRVVSSTVDKTNGLIITAARYAVEKIDSAMAG